MRVCGGDASDAVTLCVCGRWGVCSLAVAPLTPQLKQLESLPGVQETAARVMLSEIGTDMRRFDAAARLAPSLGRFPPPWLAHSPGTLQGKRFQKMVLDRHRL